MNFDDGEIIQVSDISHHQGYPPKFPVVDFHKMKAWGFAGCVIRASHGTLQDNAFVYNWPACKRVLPRASYHFYENFVAPKPQAEKYWSMIEHDFEGMMWLDLEDRSLGKYLHWDYWYQWLERLKYLSGYSSDKIGIYTGHYYWKEMLRSASEAVLEYFAKYPLWLPWYGRSRSDPLKPNFLEIPPTPPWTDENTLMVQTGTPIIGIRAGAHSFELDYNRVNGRKNYERMFGASPIKTDIQISIRRKI